MAEYIMNKKKKILNGLVYVLVFVLIFSSIVFAGRFKSFGKFMFGVEQKTFDIRQNIIKGTKTPNKDIVIIAIDDPSYEYVLDNFGSWPISRGFWAHLINSLEQANPKFIVFDLLFTKRMISNDMGDEKLIEAVKNNQNVYLSMNFDNYPYQIRKPPMLPQELQTKVENSKIIEKSHVLNFSNCRKIMDELQAVTTKIGSINVTRDEDGITRYMSPVFYYNGGFYGNLSLLVGLDYLGLNDKELVINKNNELVLDNKHKIPLSPDGRAIINWYGEEQTFEHIGLWQVDRAIKNGDVKFLKEKFENKIIYIGTTVTALADIKSTPMSYVFPGVEIHANFLNNILDNNFIKHCKYGVDFLISVILSALVAFIIIKIDTVIFALAFCMLLIGLYLFATVFAMQYFNLWLGIVMPLSSVFLTLIGSYIVKYLLKSKDYEQTYKLAVTDGLTELYNHRYFQEQMIMNVGNVARYGGAFSLILIDIDFFKKFNDKYGHQSGDAVLRQVAQTIKKNIRQSDIPCRYGGEEMSIILPNTKKADATIAAKKIWSAVRERKFELADGNKTTVTISVGVASMPVDGKNPQMLIEYADKCLYKAKQNGRDMVVDEI